MFSFSSKPWLAGITISIALVSGGVVGHAASAATCTFTGAIDHSFGKSGNWSCDVVPRPGDSVIIPIEKSVTLSGDTTIADLTINGGGSLNGGSYALNVTSLTNAGTLTMPENTLTITGGDFNNTKGAFNAGISSVVFQYDASHQIQSIISDNPISFNDLKVTAAGNAVADHELWLTSNTLYTVNHNLTVDGANHWLKLMNAAQLDVKGSLMKDNALVELDDSSRMTVETSFNNAYSFRAYGNSQLTFLQDLSNTGNGIIDGAPGATITVNGNFSQSGTNPQFFLPGIFNVGKNLDIQNGLFNVGAGTIVLTGMGPQTVTTGNSLTFNNMTLSMSQPQTVILSSPKALTINGTLSIPKNNATLQINSGAQLDAMTSVTNNGTLKFNGGTAVFHNDLNNAGTINGGTGTLMLQRGFTSSGVFNPESGTVTMSGSAGQTLPPGIGVYNNLIINNSAGVSLNRPITIGGVLAIANGTLTGVSDFRSSGPTQTGTNGTVSLGTNVVWTAVGSIANAGNILQNSGSKVVHSAEMVQFTDNNGNTLTSLTAPGMLYVTVQDGNRNRNGNIAESFDIKVTTAAGDEEMVTLTETLSASGVFRGSISVVSAPPSTKGNGKLEAVGSDTGLMTYTDAQDPSDSRSTSIALNPTGAVTVDQATKDRLVNLQSIGVFVHALVKLPDDGNPQTQEDSAVYYVGTDGRRHAFPNSKVYFTWYPNFNSVTVISAQKLASIPLGANVTYKPGARMVKFTTDLRVYAVSKGGVLRWVKTEGAAIGLYGSDWNKKIDDISDAFYVNYTFGPDISSASDYSVAGEQGSVAYVSDSLKF